MNEPASPEIQQLVRTAAEQLAGADAVKEVEVIETIDIHDRPAYLMLLLIDPPDAWQRIGPIRNGLGLKVLDGLAARGDTHQLMLQTLDHNVWPHRVHA